MVVQSGKMIIFTGILLTIIGLIINYRETLPFLKYIGRLPGDIIFKKEDFTFYFPLATSIILSIILSILMVLLRKLQ
ncbi:MAG: DUF2905 domain-containing protein [Spirochaetia bacterium]|nr:DUF2905 domain-containing protein [Spirochaetia bacterium]